MAKYKVLQPVFGEGYSVGEVIEREPHAMEQHLLKEEVEEVLGKDIKKAEKESDKIKASEEKEAEKVAKEEAADFEEEETEEEEVPEKKVKAKAKSKK